MGETDKAITLNADQVAALCSQLSEMRHKVNNYLTLITAAAEIMQRKGEALPRMLDSIMQQPNKINQEIQRFSEAMETTLGSQQEDQ